MKSPRRPPRRLRAPLLIEYSVPLAQPDPGAAPYRYIYRQPQWQLSELPVPGPGPGPGPKPDKVIGTLRPPGVSTPSLQALACPTLKSGREALELARHVSAGNEIMNTGCTGTPSTAQRPASMCPTRDCHGGRAKDTWRLSRG